MPSSFDAVSTSAGDMFMGAFVPGSGAGRGLHDLHAGRGDGAPQAGPGGAFRRKVRSPVCAAGGDDSGAAPYSDLRGAGIHHPGNRHGQSGGCHRRGGRDHHGRRAIARGQTGRGMRPAMLAIASITSVGGDRERVTHQREEHSGTSGDVVALVLASNRHHGVPRVSGMGGLANLQDRQHTDVGDGGDRENVVPGVHHPARRRHVDGRIPGFRRRRLSCGNSSPVFPVDSGRSSSSSWR